MVCGVRLGQSAYRAKHKACQRHVQLCCVHVQFSSACRLARTTLWVPPMVSVCCGCWGVRVCLWQCGVGVRVQLRVRRFGGRRKRCKR